MKRLFVAIVLAALFLTSALSAQVGTGGDTVWTRAIGAVEQVRFSPDGTTIYASYLFDSGKPAVALDAQTGEIIRQFPGMNAYRIDLSADGQFLAGCEVGTDVTNNTVYEWNALTGERTGTYGQEGAQFKAVKIYDVAYSLDGKYLAGRSYYWKDMAEQVDYWLVWDRSTKKVIYEREGKMANRVVFTPDSKYLAISFTHGSVGANYVELYKTDDWKLYTTLDGHTDAIEDMSFSPDGKYLATGGREGTLKVWDINKKELYWEIKRAHDIEGNSKHSQIYSVEFLNDQYLVTGGGASDMPVTVRLWHLPTKQLIKDLFSSASRDISTVDPAYIAAGHSWGVNLLDFSKYLGIKEKKNENGSRVLPNPTKGKTTLKFYPTTAGNFKISLFDSSMKEIKILQEGFLHSEEQRIEIDAEKLAVGTYFVQIESEQGVEYVSFVVAR